MTPFFYMLADAMRDKPRAAAFAGYVRWLAMPLMLFVVVAAARAETAAQDQPIRFSGFGTLGFVHGDAELSMQRDLLQPDTFDGDWAWQTDSLLGLQMDAALTHELNVSAQVVIKKRAEPTFAQSLEWAFIRYQPQSGFMLRAGRLGTGLYMLSDYRDVGFAYAWMRPPHEFYGALIVQHIDGADAGYVARVGSGKLQATLSGGVTDTALPAGDDASSRLEFKPFTGANLTYEAERWQVRAGAARVRFDADLRALLPLQEALSDAVQFGWTDAAPVAAGLSARGKDMHFTLRDWVTTTTSG